MGFTYIYRKGMRICRAIADTTQALIWMTRLAFVNRYSRSRITQADGPVVSLTSYGKRISTAHFTIESIAQGTVLPSRIILWLDEKPAFDDPPAALRRLQARGLEIRLTKNYGPHKKYYPFVELESSFDTPLVTADDDELYPKSWLCGLYKAYMSNPAVVNCYRARVIEVAAENEFVTYSNWSICQSTEPSHRNLATGSSGVIYPPSFLRVLKQCGTGFESCCPRNDDFWLNVQALRAGVRVRQIHRRDRIFPSIPNTQRMGLYKSNFKFGSGNDSQIKATYTASDIAALATEF